MISPTTTERERKTHRGNTVLTADVEYCDLLITAAGSALQATVGTNGRSTTQ